MPTRRVLAIGLDGYDHSLAEGMMAEGLLPALGRLRARSARFPLDHGRDMYAGLAWEHVSTGKTPAAGGRWSPVTFRASDYHVSHEEAMLAPFLADLSARAVVFDLLHCNLPLAPRVRGIVNWGAHDMGFAGMSRPDGLHAELVERFGPYPALEHLFGSVWQWPARARAAADALVRAVGIRAEAARWLLRERLPDWDLAMVTVSESHSAIEPMWHGVDPGHALHSLPSAAPAREGLRNVYAAIDDFLATLEAAFADATLVVFAMHGMGANSSDVPGMLLLGELLHRHSFGQPLLREREWHGYTPEGVPLLREKQTWQRALEASLPMPASVPPSNLDWMPVARYRHLWPRMQAFALPAFQDGRIRINLQGREGAGVVAPERYGAVRDELVELLRGCREPLRGEGVLEDIYLSEKDPYEIGPTEADLCVVWHGEPLGLVHPRHGRIGPVPVRRPGGHRTTGGFAYLAGEGLAPGDGGPASSFDVVPTIIDLLGEPRPLGLSGCSLLGRVAAATS